MASVYRPRIADAELRACLAAVCAVLLNVDLGARQLDELLVGLIRICA
jgi:hypothetical protein